jgi:hypothetical protein
MSATADLDSAAGLSAATKAKATTKTATSFRSGTDPETATGATFDTTAEPETAAEATRKSCAQTGGAFDACFHTARDLGPQTDSCLQPGFDAGVDGAGQAAHQSSAESKSSVKPCLDSTAETGAQAATRFEAAADRAVESELTRHRLLQACDRVTGTEDQAGDRGRGSRLQLRVGHARKTGVCQCRLRISGELLSSHLVAEELKDVLDDGVHACEAFRVDFENHCWMGRATDRNVR